ncbi:acyltransferase [Providencia huashanensis]|uniref:acyltransferase n=1 Tax=Providencia huashanensis TaxID=3037798 RepID=UPI002AFDEA41|nr:DapH/DapD/GlmU-related protein [Providencia sp. 3007]
MSILYKISWFVNAKFYKFFFGHIGKNSIIGKCIFLHNPKNIFIGNRVRIFPGSRFENHNKGKILINDDVSIGQNLHIISSDQQLVIGSGTTISSNVCITNVDHNYTDIMLPVAYQGLTSKKTLIGDNCFIGYGTIIQAGTILRKHCIIGANSVVKGHFPDYSVIAGNPGKIIKCYSNGNWIKTEVQ